MGFSLSNLISYGSNTASGIKDTSGVGSMPPTQSDKGMVALQGMTPGETLQGEVMSVNGNQVEIKVAEDAVISAKLEHGMGISVGQKMMFEVQKNNNGQIALRALFTNLAQEQLAHNALQAAGLPQDIRSLQMIANLMKEGMSIDRQSLQSMFHDVVQFPEAEQSLLVHMHKIGMETTPQNVEQFQALIHYGERITSTINELIHALPGELHNMSFNGEAAKVMTLTGELFTMLAENIQVAENEGMINSDGIPVMKGEETVISETQSEMQSVQTANGQSATDKALAALQEAMNPQNEAHMLVNSDSSKEHILAASNLQGEESVLSSNDSILSGVLTKAEYTELADLLKQNSFSQELVQKAQGGNVPLNELFVMMKNELAGKDAMISATLWDNAAFVKLMGKELQKAWLLNPSEVENGKNISEFYNRMNQQVNTIIQSMSQSLAESSVLSQNLQQFRENVDFLNNLNQYMPYVQLPLKMNGQSATGDLFVYADKNSLASGKDTVSAALHLDMKYLGHLDVYVKMQNRNVNTDFCLENEETLDFLSQHIDMLNERLERRGYHLSSEMKVKEEPSSLKEDVLPMTEMSNSEKDSKDVVAIYRFDVRA